MAQAETAPNRNETDIPVKPEISPLYIRVTEVEKATAEAEALSGGFRSVSDWARRKLFYGWKKQQGDVE